MEKLVCSLGKSLENSENFFSYSVDAECHKKSCSDCYTIQNHESLLNCHLVIPSLTVKIAQGIFLLDPQRPVALFSEPYILVITHL